MRALAAVLALLAAMPPAQGEEALWRRIAGGGHVLLIRHAATEAGLGDPPGFRVDDCRSQRNLSPAGRDDARRLGQAFRAAAVPVAEVRTSPWCRCIDTARLAFGDAVVWEPLSSLFNDASAERRRVDAVLDYLRKAPAGGNIVLVTHNFNIRALTGVSPVTGETVVARVVDGRLELVGRLQVSGGP